MDTYIYNPSKCPQYFGQLVIPGESYCVATEAAVKSLKANQVPIQFEDTPGYRPLWVQNIPERTPREILDTV